MWHVCLPLFSEWLITSVAQYLRSVCMQLPPQMQAVPRISLISVPSAQRTFLTTLVFRIIWLPHVIHWSCWMLSGNFFQDMNKGKGII